MPGRAHREILGDPLDEAEQKGLPPRHAPRPGSRPAGSYQLPAGGSARSRRRDRATQARGRSRAGGGGRAVAGPHAP
jgi:hypothetical protein